MVSVFTWTNSRSFFLQVVRDICKNSKLSFEIPQAFASMIENGRLEPRDTDVQPYVVDGVTSLAELNHGVRKAYYYGAAYGDQALPELAQFT